jgi:hypothetical protein
MESPHSYKVKVRDKVYLWGSASISEAPGVALLLSIHVDHVGEAIDIYRDAPGHGSRSIGRLEPGQVFTLNLKDSSSIYATCEHGGDVLVSCVLHTPSGG